MAQAPFLNPTIPFVGPIQNGLKQGTLISVQGTSFPLSNRLCLNLQIGPNVAPRDSVALHVALDFSRNLIVRNTIQGQNWGIEETHGPPVSLVRGQPFKLDILCDAYEYKIAFNGAHYAEMKHRMPFQTVFYIAIDGEAQLHAIQIDSSGNRPFGGPAMPGYMSTPGHMSMPMPGQIPVPGSQVHGYTSSMPGIPPGSGPPYTSGYSVYPGQTHNSPYLHKHKRSPIKNAINQGLNNYAMTGHISPRKAAKAQRKQAKKALKYGIPVAGVAGVGVGAYAMHKSHKHKGFKHKKGSKSSSSSSSSSSSD